MNLSLNPKAFPGPLVLEWFASEEGDTWEVSLQRCLKKLSISQPELSFVQDRVAETLELIGLEKLRRHFEIKPIAQAADLGLVELRWDFRQIPEGLKLRLYCSLLPEKSQLVGLCFRPKRILETASQTKSAQNKDILEAIRLSKKLAANYGNQ